MFSVSFCRLNNYRLGLTATLRKHVLLISVLITQLYLNKLISLLYLNKLISLLLLHKAVLYNRVPNFVKLDLRDFDLS
jgi:hypothetical protein